MNLMEFRAMRAQEAEQTQTQVEGGANAQAVQVPTEPNEVSTTQTEQIQPTPNAEGATDTAQAVPQTIEVNGQQVSIDELRNGYLRQSDYTKKTQEVANQRREAEDALQIFEAIKGNPELSKQLNIDPREIEARQLAQHNADLELQLEINELSSRYADFNVQEVLDLAYTRELNNLEDAYLLNKTLKSQVTQQDTTLTSTAVDVEAMKAQVRAEILAELKAEQNTQTIISGQGGAPVTDTTPQLSDAELRIARGMRMTPEEYVKWR